MNADDLATAVVIDDDPTVRHLLTQVFEAAGFSAISAETGADGVQAILQIRPLVATVDLSMPGVDGVETVRQVRAGGSTTHLIMVTASNEETDIVLSLSAGADEYLVKPVRVRELRARVDAVLRRARAIRAAAVPAEPEPLPPAPWMTPVAAPAATPANPWPQQAPGAAPVQRPAAAAYVPESPWPQQSPAAARATPGTRKQYVFTLAEPAHPVADG